VDDSTDEVHVNLDSFLSPDISRAIAGARVQCPIVVVPVTACVTLPCVLASGCRVCVCVCLSVCLSVCRGGHCGGRPALPVVPRSNGAAWQDGRGAGDPARH
jgi:hypothetical protein